MSSFKIHYFSVYSVKARPGDIDALTQTQTHTCTFSYCMKNICNFTIFIEVTKLNSKCNLFAVTFIITLYSEIDNLPHVQSLVLGNKNDLVELFYCKFVQQEDPE